MSDKSFIRILWLSPQLPPSEFPLVDHLTQKLVFALKNAAETGQYFKGAFIPFVNSFGTYKCRCCKTSYPAEDFRISQNLIVSSLSVHILAFHREEIAVKDIELLNALDSGGSDIEEVLKAVST